MWLGTEGDNLSGSGNVPVTASAVCVYWEEVSSGWVPVVQRVQCVSLQCRGAALLSLPLLLVGWTLGQHGAVPVGQGGHPVHACSVPVWSGREWKGTVSAVREGNSICWQRVWGCLVTVQQRGDAVPAIAVCWGCTALLLLGEIQGLLMGSVCTAAQVGQ